MGVYSLQCQLPTARRLAKAPRQQFTLAPQLPVIQRQKPLDLRSLQQERTQLAGCRLHAHLTDLLSHLQASTTVVIILEMRLHTLTHITALTDVQQRLIVAIKVVNPRPRRQRLQSLSTEEPRNCRFAQLALHLNI